MPRILLAAALVAVPLAHAQTARTDTAPARAAEVLPASADTRLPESFQADAATDDERARRLSAFYARHAELLRLDADNDDARFAVQLDALVADVRAASLRSGALSDLRFRELYSSVMTEYERFYGEPVIDRGDVYAVRAAGIDAIERGFDSGAPLLEHVTLPDLQTFTTEIPMDVNPEVERYVQFLLNRPSHVQRLRSRADTYFPMVERIMAEEGVPDELKYLAMVESALNPTARSHAAAVGMWQFISATGRAYGLRAEREVDDRMDPEVATRAAARHLRDLYDRFGDWQLALAGYNCNPAVIARGVRRFEEQTGQRATFWDIDHVIPRETRAYVPMFIATALILSNPDAYGFEAHEPGPSFVFDRIPVAGGTRLSTVAGMIGVQEEVLRALNPSLRQGRVPDVRVPHQLRIPVGSYAEFAADLDGLAPPEANTDRWAAETVSFGTRAVRPLAPQDHDDALVALAARRETRRANQPRRVVRDAPVERYAAAVPPAAAAAESRMARAEQVTRAEQVARAERVRQPAPAPLAAPVAEAVAPVAEAVTQPAAVAQPAPAVAVVERAAPEPIAEAVSVTAADGTFAPPSDVVDRVAEAQAGRDVEWPASHRVAPGETLGSLAARFGMTADEMREMNPGVRSASAGQTLRVVGGRAPIAEPVSEPVAEAAPSAPAPTAEAPAIPIRTVSDTAGRTATHRVQRGEYLLKIARDYGMTLDELRDLNPGVGTDLAVGQRLTVVSGRSAPAAASPTRPSTHRVRPGEHLTGLARQYGVSVNDLREWNDLRSDVLHVGQRLRLRARGSRG